MTKLEGMTNDQMTADRDDASSSFVIRGMRSHSASFPIAQKEMRKCLPTA